MKKNMYLLKPSLSTLLLLCVSILAFGQGSFTILPTYTTIEALNGDNLNLASSSPYIGIQGIRYGGTVNSKTAVLNNDPLFRIGAGGYHSTTASYIDMATIVFKASQNWNGSSTGTKIAFKTTANNTAITADRMVIEHNGNVGIGNSAPMARLHITHLGSAGSPHLLLQNTGSNSSFIRATSTAGTEWDNHFINSATGASSLVYWTNSVNSATPLILTGEGDAAIERNAAVGGFTNLGATAPKIKMKELTLTTSPTAGGVAFINHGLTQSKILSVSVLVNSVPGQDFPPSYSSAVSTGFLYNYHITFAAIVIENSNGNHANIAGRPARILITYKE